MLHSLMLALLAMMLPTAPSAAVCTAESALRARHEISQRCVTDFGTQAREARQQITRKYGDHASDSTHASRGGAAAAEASSAANAVRLGKQLASEEAAAELLSGGGKVIA